MGYFSIATDWVISFSYVFGLWMTFQLIFYFLFHVVQFVLRYRQPMKLGSKYRTKWALITGGSTGIGGELASILAAQGMNLVIVALPDKYLQKKITRLSKMYRKQNFYPIGIDFRTDDYLLSIEKLVKDKNLDIGVVINNAGYMKIGKFHEISLSEQIDNVKVNCLSYLSVSHFFYSKWIEDRRECGFLGFTASCSSYFFQPYGLIYGATKAFDNHFIQSLAIEGFHHGIDVLSFNPQMVTSKNFHSKEESFLPVKLLSYLFPTSPESCAKAFLNSVGRTYIRNHGWFSHFIFLFKTSFFGLENVLILLLGFLLSIGGFIIL